MRIAILGATSQIAKDLIVSFSAEKETRLHLFARRPDEVRGWLAFIGLSANYPVDEFSEFPKSQSNDALRTSAHSTQAEEYFLMQSNRNNS